MADAPRLPRGLRAPGKRLWVAVAQKYVLTPAELFELRLEEWQAPGDLDREPAFQRWAAARRAWFAEHLGTALGGMLGFVAG
jgi:hypothetical protein